MTKQTLVQAICTVIVFTCISLIPRQQEGQYTFPWPPQQEKEYLLRVPAHLAQPAWFLLNGFTEQVTVSQQKEVLQLISAQFQQQDNEFKYQDSVARMLIKRDSSKTKKP